MTYFYFDSQFQPTTADKAVMVKVFNNDGTSEFAVIEREGLIAKADTSGEPRDQKGKWTTLGNAGEETKRWIIGRINKDFSIKAAHTTDKGDHAKLRLNADDYDARWRYNKDTKKLFWWRKPSPDHRDEVKAYLEQRGHEVKVQLNLIDHSAEAHGIVRKTEFEHMDIPITKTDILSEDQHEVFCTITKKDGAKQIVYGMVYAPDLLDRQGDMMTQETVEEMAHAFLQKTNLKDVVDHEHDNWPKDCYPVESWIQKGEDPDGLYLPGAWCLGIKVNDPALWEKVEKGEINGFSFQGTAARRKVLVEYEYLPTIIGVTDPAADGHTHSYVVKTDEDGKPTYGETSKAPDGHFHEIQRGTATNAANDHKHRINLKTV